MTLLKRCSYAIDSKTERAIQKYYLAKFPKENRRAKIIKYSDLPEWVKRVFDNDN